MFREMYRSKQAISREECIQILKTETRGVLSVIGDDGYPYGSPINHFYHEEDGRIYFHGQTFGHKIDAIKADPKVSLCVVEQGTKRADHWSYDVKSVIVFGKAEIDEDFDHAMQICKLLCDKFPSSEDEDAEEFRLYADKTLVFSMSIEHMTGKTTHEA